MSLENQPGYFGLTSQGVIAIHADWPIYPEEHGADLALLWLTAFPPGTRFRSIDDIDRCILLVADVKNWSRKPFHKRNFHVAIWHQDLLEMQEKGLVDGVSPISERRWERAKRAQLPQDPLFIKIDGETPRTVELRPLTDYDDDFFCWPEVSDQGLVVTSAGRDHSTNLLSSTSDHLDVLGERVQHIFRLGYFDTAVREACVTLEHRLKEWLVSDRWGDKLVDEFCARLSGRGIYPNTHVRVLGGQLRTAFKFIRNDFMHNLVGTDETQSLAILFRLARVNVVIGHVMIDG